MSREFYSEMTIPTRTAYDSCDFTDYGESTVPLPDRQRSLSPKGFYHPSVSAASPSSPLGVSVIAIGRSLAKAIHSISATAASTITAY